MMVELGFTPRELAYLFGSIGGMLQHAGLAGSHRAALQQLRDRLVPYVSLDEDVACALGLPAAGARH